MTKAEIKNHRRRLLTLKQRLGNDLSELEEQALHAAGGEFSGGLSDVPTHLADLGTDAYEEEIALGLLENARQLLAEIDGALARLEEGKFGRCEECRTAIAKKRLAALPYTRWCLRCARQREAGAAR